MTRSRSLRNRRTRLSIGLALSLLGVGYGLGGCGGEASQFPPPPSLGPAPEGGKATAGTTGQDMGSLTGSGGDAGGADGDGDGGGEPTDGGKAGTTTGGTTAGTTTGGTAGSGGGDPNPNCGNDAVDDGEECDDGNRQSGDGCSSQCKDKCETCEVAAYEHYVAQFGDDTDWRALCYEDETLAEGGPAAGVERNILCHDLVECIRRTGCGHDRLRGNSFNYNNLDLTYCLCSNERAPGTSSGQIPAECYIPDEFEAGPCFVPMLEASEGDSITSAVARLINANFPLARAVNLIRQSDYLWCEDECMACTGPGAVGNGGGGTDVQEKGPCLPTQ